MNENASPSRPWYREAAPWALMAGPLAVVIAGVVTIWLALRHPDGLVTDDYYKRGLLVERRLDREQAAARAGLLAKLNADPTSGRLRVEIHGRFDTPERWTLLLRHAARPELDRNTELVAQADGAYGAPFAELAPGRWVVVLESEAFRLEGVWHWPQTQELFLGAGR